VKDAHRNPTIFLQPHVILESKWEVISMEFIIRFPPTTWNHASISMVVDTMMKSAHFIPIHTTYQAQDITRVFINEIVILHEVPRRIIPDQGSMFTRHFWTNFQEALGPQMNFSTMYHPEIDGKIERTNQILEDMLHMYDKKNVGNISSH
jgi:hypothetical protein